MKSLKTIQTLSKIGKIISTIIFVCCIVGFCLCIAGIVCLACGIDGLKIGNVTLKGLIQDEASISADTLYASMAAGAIFCAAEAVLSKAAANYFKKELADGTPFTFDGAKKMQNLGILAICISVGTQIVAAIVYAILEKALPGVAPMNATSFGSVSIGIMFIVMAQVCRCGAELNEKNKFYDNSDDGGTV